MNFMKVEKRFLMLFKRECFDAYQFEGTCKLLTPKQRLPIALAQVETSSASDVLNEIHQIHQIFFVSSK